MANKFSPISNLPNRSELESIVDNLEYKRIDVSELPEEIKGNGLTDKFNSVIIAASGSTDSMVYSVIGLRPDGDDIDEHPFVFYYDNNNPSSNFGGIIHHGNWPGRTFELSENQKTALNLSGLTASFTYKDIPTNSSGSLYDLQKKGMLEGITSQFKILLNKKSG